MQIFVESNVVEILTFLFITLDKQHTVVKYCNCLLSLRVPEIFFAIRSEVMVMIIIIL